MTTPGVTLIGTVRIGQRRQGPTDYGQGGWSASRLANFMPGPTTVRLLAHVPLERDLHVVEAGEGLDLMDPADGRLIMAARPWVPDPPKTAPVSIAEARAARARCPFANERHPVPFCFSCGLQPDSMNTHAGPLGDGRVATDWRPPAWAVDDDGAVDAGVIWAALDCASGFYVSADGEKQISFTAQYAVEVLTPLDPSETYAIVAWSGEAPAAWDGRKRRAAAAAFDSRGRMTAYARSFWVAAREQP